MSRTTTWGIWFFEHFVFSIFHFWTLIKSASDGFAINSKLHFTCPAEDFEGKMPFFWKNLMRCKMALYLSRGRFRDFFLHNCCFSNPFWHWTKSFGLLTELFFIRVFKTAFYLSREILLWFFPEKTVFVFCRFGFWLEIARTFIKKYAEASLKRHSLCPEQQFEENGVLKPFFLVFFISRSFLKKHWMICKNLFELLSESLREVP